jgi:hypothetical protein
MLNKPCLKGIVDNDCQEIIARCSPVLVIRLLRYMASASQVPQAQQFYSQLKVVLPSSSSTVLGDQYSDLSFSM